MGALMLLNLRIFLWCYWRLLRGEPKGEVAAEALRTFFPDRATPDAIRRLMHG